MQFHYTEGSKVGDTSYYVRSPKSGVMSPCPLLPWRRVPYSQPESESGCGSPISLVTLNDI